MRWGTINNLTLLLLLLQHDQTANSHFKTLLIHNSSHQSISKCKTKHKYTQYVNRAEGHHGRDHLPTFQFIPTYRLQFRDVVYDVLVTAAIAHFLGHLKHRRCLGLVKLVTQCPTNHSHCRSNLLCSLLYILNYNI